MTKPFEARRLPELPETPDMRAAFSDLMTAVAGFPHPSASADALVYGLRWLRANPGLADVLLGRVDGGEGGS